MEAPAVLLGLEYTGRCCHRSPFPAMLRTVPSLLCSLNSGRGGDPAGRRRREPTEPAGTGLTQVPGTPSSRRSHSRLRRRWGRPWLGARLPGSGPGPGLTTGSPRGAPSSALAERCPWSASHSGVICRACRCLDTAATISPGPGVQDKKITPHRMQPPPHGPSSPVQGLPEDPGPGDFCSPGTGGRPGNACPQKGGSPLPASCAGLIFS